MIGCNKPKDHFTTLLGQEALGLRSADAGLFRWVDTVINDPTVAPVVHEADVLSVNQGADYWHNLGCCLK